MNLGGVYWGILSVNFLFGGYVKINFGANYTNVATVRTACNNISTGIESIAAVGDNTYIRTTMADGIINYARTNTIVAGGTVTDVNNIRPS